MVSNSIVEMMIQEMSKSVQVFQQQLAKVRTGRASAALVESVQVHYYGSHVPISQVANLTTPDARTIQIVPWEANMLSVIEKAILAANIGFTPQNDGKVIRIPMPALTEERRKEMVKSIKKMGEDTKVVIRNHRRDANENIKRQEKDKQMSSDESKKTLEMIQKKTDEKIMEIDKLIVLKEKEVMTV